MKRLALLVALLLTVPGCIRDTCGGEDDVCELCQTCIVGLMDCDEDWSYDGRCDGDGSCSRAIDDPWCERATERAQHADAPPESPPAL
jgi:hypothetical protein